MKKANEKTHAAAAAFDRDAIAYAAYMDWEKDGKPDGRDMEYWLAAEKKLSATPDFTKVMPRKVKSRNHSVAMAA